MIQSGGFLGKFLGPLLRTGLPLMKNVIKPLAKSVLIAADLSKQQALDTDPRANHEIIFTANLDRADNTRIYFILEEAKETILEFSLGTVKVL